MNNIFEKIMLQLGYVKKLDDSSVPRLITLSEETHNAILKLLVTKYPNIKESFPEMDVIRKFIFERTGLKIYRYEHNEYLLCDERQYIVFTLAN